MSAGGPAVRRLTAWDAGQLREVADDHGTPVYVLDLGRIRENCRRMTNAFADAAVFYAAKANTARAVLRTVHDAGLGVECASIGEVRRALDAGVPAEDVLYTAVNPPAGDLDMAVTIDGLTITVGAVETLDRLAERGYRGRVFLRVNPGVGAGHHAHVTTGDNPKFGVPYDRAEAVLEEAVARGFDVVGLHAHAGSGITPDALDAHQALVERMGALARKAAVDLEVVDVGGGFGVPYRPNDPPLDLDAVATATREALGDVPAQLAVEPGRYIVADAGVLVTRVNTIKDAESDLVVGVDAGMNTLIRPALYGAYHHMINLAADADRRARRTVTVAGPICESADIFGSYGGFAVPERGDYLAIGNGGAYGYEMTSQYNSRPRPGVIGLDAGERVVLREPETLSDITRGETEVYSS